MEGEGIQEKYPQRKWKLKKGRYLKIQMTKDS